MKRYSPPFSIILLFSLFTACKTAYVESGRAVYFPAGSALANQYAVARDTTGEAYRIAQLTNLQNGHTVRAVILKREVTGRGVVVSIDKKAAQSLGIIYTGAAPVDIKYKHTTSF